MSSSQGQVHPAARVTDAESAEAADEEYTRWAPGYEQDLVKINYVGNESMATRSIHLINNEESSLMLDVAAGTGKTAESFKKAGFKGIIDAIEINAAMLEIAKPKGIYRKAICAKVCGEQPLPVEDVFYDAVVIGGAVLENHLPQDSMPRIVDTLKSGGYLIFNCRTTERNANYQEILRNVMQELVDSKVLALITEETIPYHQKPEFFIPAQLFIYRKV